MNRLSNNSSHKSWGISPHNWDDKIKNGVDPEGCDVYFAYKRALETRLEFLGVEPGRFSRFSSYERDKDMLTGIADLMNRHDRVLVVAGAGHFVQQELVLEKMFGKPRRLYK